MMGPIQAVHDLRAVGPTVDIAESLKKPLVFVVNSATATSTAASRASRRLTPGDHSPRRVRSA